MRINSMKEIKEHAARIGPKRIAVAGPAEDDIFKALADARRLGIIRGYLVGPLETIRPFAELYGLNPPDFEIVESEMGLAAKDAVKLVRDGRADFLMKGTIPTSDFLKALLDKETGLRKPDHLLSHVSIHEVPGFPRMLIITDVAFNITPTLEEKAKIIDNAITIARVIGIEVPKVACVAAIEKVNPKIPATVEAAELARMSRENRFPGAIVEGPFGFDNAVDLRSAEIKGIRNEVAGVADIILVPDMQSGNFIYKTLTTIAGGTVAAVVVGATAPVILTSRADSDESKLVSLALGVLNS
ncbi:bifunctional enoyl-CoA hydratase/phosphate acetyltransferase [bacterium]|nr:bifunctional enoyl-CoA hydratase/phosphate acetyltransferase [candidate division CSSED10-310 bacterium]